MANLITVYWMRAVKMSSQLKKSVPAYGKVKAMYNYENGFKNHKN